MKLQWKMLEWDMARDRRTSVVVGTGLRMLLSRWERDKKRGRAGGLEEEFMAAPLPCCDEPRLGQQRRRQKIGRFTISAPHLLASDTGPALPHRAITAAGSRACFQV
jgi:hypothetical protein